MAGKKNNNCGKFSRLVALLFLTRRNFSIFVFAADETGKRGANPDFGHLIGLYEMSEQGGEGSKMIVVGFQKVPSAFTRNFFQGWNDISFAQ